MRKGIIEKIRFDSKEYSSEIEIRLLRSLYNSFVEGELSKYDYLTSKDKNIMYLDIETVFYLYNLDIGRVKVINNG